LDDIFRDYDAFYKAHLRKLPFVDVSRLTPECLASWPDMGWVRGKSVNLFVPEVEGGKPVSVDRQTRQLDGLIDSLKAGAVAFRHGHFPGLLPEGYAEAICALDCETENLDTRALYGLDRKLIRQNRVCGISAAVDSGAGFYLPTCHVEEPGEGIFNWAEEASVHFLDRVHREFCVVYHNAQFDREMMALHGCTGFRPFPYFFDTLLLSFLCDVNSKSHGLKFLSAKILGQRMATLEEVFESRDFFVFSSIPARAAYVYGSLDATQTFSLFKRFTELPVGDNPLVNQPVPVQIDHKTVDALRQTYRAGMPVNLEYCIFAARDSLDRAVKLAEAIEKFVGRKIEFNSPRVISKLIFDEYKVPPLEGAEVNKTGLYSVDEETLESLHKLYPEYTILENIVLYRKFNSNLSKIFYKLIVNSYVDAFVPFARTAISLSLTTVPTGRLSSSSSQGRRRVITKEGKRGQYIHRLSPETAGTCGLNCQGIPVMSTASFKVRRIRANPLFTKEFLEYPYGEEGDMDFYLGVNGV
jgi:hypothetical protein